MEGIILVIKHILENVVQAKQQVENLEAQGYSRDDIYIFDHSKKRGDDISETLNTEEVGMAEQGFFDSMKNMFTSRGDELRSKMEAAGLSAEEASDAEAELDKGKLVLIVNKLAK